MSTPIANVIVSTQDFSGATVLSIHASADAAKAAEHTSGVGMACPLFSRSGRAARVGDLVRMAIGSGGWEAWLS